MSFVASLSSKLVDTISANPLFGLSDAEWLMFSREMIEQVKVDVRKYVNFQKSEVEFVIWPDPSVADIELVLGVQSHDVSKINDDSYESNILVSNE